MITILNAQIVGSDGGSQIHGVIFAQNAGRPGNKVHQKNVKGKV